MAQSLSRKSACAAPRRIVQVGAGGNIGSHATQHLARIEGLTDVTLIDGEVYEEKNLASQDILPRHVGQPKAAVQRRRMKQINPRLKVTSLVARVESLPLGALECDLLISCVDSRATRQYLNEALWRLGIPWIDAAVDGPGMLARVNVYVPGPQAACAECAWNAADYGALEQSHPCQAAGLATPATNAPSTLGAAAAALAVCECRKMLAGEWDCVLRGKQALLDLRHHTHFITTYTRNQRCRFDHQVWAPQRLPISLARQTLQGLIAATTSGSQRGKAELRLFGRSFVQRFACPRCASPFVRHLSIEGRGAIARRRCVRCSALLAATGFDAVDWLPVAKLDARDQERSLRSLGFAGGDVVTIRAGGRPRHFLLLDQRRPDASPARNGSEKSGATRETVR